MEKQKVHELAKSASQGNMNALNELLKEKSQGILYNTMGIMGNYHDAQDAAQEVVIGVYKSIETLRTPEYFDAWLHKIISNVCKRMYKKKINMNETYDANESIVLIEEDRKEFLPQEYAENKEMREILVETINALPERRKRAIYMYYFDDMSYAEIAFAMDIQVSTVATSIMRAKETIKINMKEKVEQIDNVVPYETTEKVGSMTAAPVVAQALHYNADVLFPKEMIVKVLNLSDLAAKGLKAKGANNAGVGISAKLSKRIIIKIVIAVVVTTGVITAGTISIIKNNFDDTNATETAAVEKNIDQSNIENIPEFVSENVKSQIILNGNDCDCGHVNPTTAITEYENFIPEGYIWEIADAEKNKIVTSGSSNVVNDELSSLYKSKKDGKYTMYFSAYDKYDNEVQVKRDFVIDSGNISPDQYK